MFVFCDVHITGYCNNYLVIAAESVAEKLLFSCTEGTLCGICINLYCNNDSAILLHPYLKRYLCCEFSVKTTTRKMSQRYLVCDGLKNKTKKLSIFNAFPTEIPNASDSCLIFVQGNEQYCYQINKYIRNENFIL